MCGKMNPQQRRKRRFRPTTLFACLLALAVIGAAPGCSTNCHELRKGHMETQAAKYSVWQKAPGVELPEALTRALGHLRAHGVNLSDGYVLEAFRAGPSWWFTFVLLPKSPDYSADVRVYDDGRITEGL
jgi:hypothetical protein